MESISSMCQRATLIPVLSIAKLEDAVPLAQALAAGGLTVLEVTLRTPVALAAIERIATACPGLTVGAGTLKTPDDVTDCLSAGAVFGVSPGAPVALLERVHQTGLPFLPGCATPTEAMQLSDQGFEVLKFFPAAAAGGVSMLSALTAPLPHLAFCPTGGVSLENAADYLRLPNVPVVGGTWVAPMQLVADQDWPAITRLAHQTFEHLCHGAPLSP